MWIWSYKRDSTPATNSQRNFYTNFYREPKFYKTFFEGIIVQFEVSHKFLCNGINNHTYLQESEGIEMLGNVRFKNGRLN